MEIDYEELSDPPALIAARRIWAAGNTLPMDLAVKLMGLGYDVDALESKYLN